MSKSSRGQRLLELIRLVQQRSGWRWEGGKAVHVKSQRKVWLDEKTGLFMAVSYGQGFFRPDNALRAAEPSEVDSLAL